MKKRQESRAEKDLRMIASVLSGGVGEHHLRMLAQALGQALDADMAWIGQLVGSEGDRLQTVGLYLHGKIVDNATYEVANMPCADVLEKEISVYRSGVRERFPLVPRLAQLHAESYAGMSLVDSLGRVLGMIGVVSSRRIHDEERVTTLLRIFGARAALELERGLMDEQTFRQVTAAL